MLSNNLLKILVCPVCKGELAHDNEARTLCCPPCQLTFPVKEGIPVMLPEEAAASAFQVAKDKRQ